MAARVAGDGRSAWREAGDTLAGIAIALAAALLIRQFVVETYRVQGPSMEPTLYTGERLLVDKLVVRLRGPRPGDIVVLQPPTGTCPDVLADSPDFVKRVVATAGQTVEMRNGVLYVDGAAVDESWLPPAYRDQPTDQMPPVRVPTGTVWVMGDNRDDSTDSRCFGPVPLRSVRGVAMVVWWPPSAIRRVQPEP